jgi:hypothetical protein
MGSVKELAVPMSTILLRTGAGGDVLASRFSKNFSSTGADWVTDLPGRTGGQAPFSAAAEDELLQSRWNIRRQTGALDTLARRPKPPNLRRSLSHFLRLNLVLRRHDQTPILSYPKDTSVC